MAEKAVGWRHPGYMVVKSRLFDDLQAVVKHAQVVVPDKHMALRRWTMDEVKIMDATPVSEAEVRRIHQIKTVFRGSLVVPATITQQSGRN
jgi:hypothetical protein